jgi:hypothetical protein
MGFFGRLFNRDANAAKNAKGNTGGMRKDAGAGPALAAHSKDAKSENKTGQNQIAAGKKS